MNTANKLTVLRIIIIPFYLLFLLVEISKFHFLIATLLFIIASITDALDGKIARKYNMITVFGKFADPLADKLLVLSGMIAFVELGLMPSWVCIIIMAREIAISGFRLVCADNGTVIAASKLGKLKTVSQMMFIILTSINFNDYLADSAQGFCSVVEVLRLIIMYFALVMTIVSMIDYFYKNKNAFNTSK